MRNCRIWFIVSAVLSVMASPGALAQTTTIDFSGPTLSPTLVPYGNATFKAQPVNDSLQISFSYDGSQGSITEGGGVRWTTPIVGDYVANITIDVSGLPAVTSSSFFINGGPFLADTGGGAAFVGPWNDTYGTSVNGAKFINGNYYGGPVTLFKSTKAVDVEISRIGDQITEYARPSGQGAYQELLSAQGPAFLGTTNLQLGLFYQGAVPIQNAVIDYSNASVTRLTSTVPEESESTLLVAGLAAMAWWFRKVRRPFGIRKR